MTAIPIQVNCGYARVAIREVFVSVKELKCNNERINNSVKISTSYHLKFWKTTLRTELSQQHSERILARFSKRWYQPESKKTYTNTFSLSKWEDLPDSEKAKHTLGKCNGCALQFTQLQSMFPLKPFFNGPPSLKEVYAAAADAELRRDEADRECINAGLD